MVNVHEKVKSKPDDDAEKEVPPEPTTSAKVGGCILMAVLGALLLGGAWWALSLCGGQSEESKKENLENRRKGFHCLSAWDGNHDGFEALVRPRLLDPDSMKTYETLIGQVRNGKHHITMNFGAKNLFGGMNRFTAKGEVNHDTCEATLTELY